MILLISPLIKQQYAGIIVATTVSDVEKKLKEKDIDKVIMYPFLKLGDNTWCKDINWGGYVAARIKATLPNIPIHIIMDADHHAEPFEPIRYLGHELGYCTQHNVHQIDEFVQSVITNTMEQGYAKLKIDSCFHNDSAFWLNRIKEIQTSQSLYKEY